VSEKQIDNLNQNQWALVHL